MKMSIFKTLLLGLLLSSFTLSAFAGETLTLNDLRREVLDENIDVKIQYEKYYQAQQNVKVKLGEFLPNLNVQLLFWNSTYAILYSVVPTPSNWFVYQSSQELAIAEKYITDSIKLNILRDLTLTYLNILHQEKIKASMIEQEQQLVVAYERAQNLEALGFGDEAQTFTTLRSLLEHRQDIFALDSVIAAQKEALYLSLGRRPGTDIELTDYVPSEEDIPVSVETAIQMAYDNSPELKANIFMQESARYMVKSATWSFVSFSGIGLGYPATVRIEKSKLREIILEGDKLENQIANQIDLAYSKLDNLKLRIETQAEILVAAKIELERITELYNVGQATLDELVRAQSAVLSEERSLVTLEMQKDVQIVEIKRLLGIDATDNDILVDDLNSVSIVANVSESRYRKSKVSVDLDMPNYIADEIVSVVYSGDIFNYRLSNTTGNFSLFTRTRASGTKVVMAEILFKSGQKLNLETTVEL